MKCDHQAGPAQALPTDRGAYTAGKAKFIPWLGTDRRGGAEDKAPFLIVGVAPAPASRPSPIARRRIRCR